MAGPPRAPLGEGERVAEDVLDAAPSGASGLTPPERELVSRVFAQTGSRVTNRRSSASRGIAC
jgi:hypothetical protein